MALVAMRYLYRRLGGWYPLVFLVVELQSALLIVAATLALFAFYFDGDTGQYISVLLISLALTEVAAIAARPKSSNSA